MKAGCSTLGCNYAVLLLQLQATKADSAVMTSKLSWMLSQTKSSKQSMPSMHSKMSQIQNPLSLLLMSRMPAVKANPSAHLDQ